MRRPRIKYPHRPVRYGPSLIRIGGLVPGIRRDLIDPDGWAWELLNLLDGSRTTDEVAEELTRLFPHRSQRLVRAAIEDLMIAGHVEDADEPASRLAPAARRRYGRSRALSQWMDLTPRRTGWETQVLLGGAKVALVGIGGAGCVVALNLVLSGVGRLHCVDRDVIERSNLNRQILYADADVGTLKIDVAVPRLRTYNSSVEVTGECRDVDGPEALRDLAAGFDVVVLAADRPRDIRSWTNRACLDTGTPWVHAGYHGPLVTVGLYRPSAGPCSDCLPAARQARQEELPERTEWIPGIASAYEQAANATSAGFAGNFAAHAAISLITGVPALQTNREFAFNLVDLTSVPVIALDTPYPRCPSCRSRR
ncbi:ThiF family adenylyltransferase [Micromonospora sp. NPDC005220]|uniref:HesA/MoeB/ThiF family protein n=1 Tax=Micromonospora sp. NPDC005220 TaxID=3155589 RepID=UPI0033BF9BE1